MAPAIREADGSFATAHVVLGVTDRQTRRRLLAEVTAVRNWSTQLENPPLAALLDHAVDADGHPVLFTTPFGPNLAGELAARGPLPLHDVMTAARAAAAGLAALHETGRLHHVVSPRALLRLPGNGFQLSSPAVPTLAEQVALDRDGTGHEPPEVLTSGEWTVAGDVYALASAVWTLLAGVPPTSGSQEERLARIYSAKPLSMSRQDVPATVLTTLTAALATDPAARPASAHELMAMLEGRTGVRAAPVSSQDTLPPNTLTPVTGRPLGKDYWLDERIDEGSAGAVYRARRLSDGAQLAAKLLHRKFAGDQGARTRFLAEGATLLRVKHPNLVRMHDMIADGHDLAIVMDLVDGAALRTMVLDPRLGRSERLRLLAQIAEALSAVHAEGIVHRDVKPDNVLVTGDEPTALLTDFGIAKALGTPTITHHSQLLGTMAYVAPELATGRGVTPACDVYSLGITAYELLAMRRPFPDDNPAALIQAHVTRPLPRPAEITDQEWELVSACLRKEPSARPPAEEVATRLAQLADQPSPPITASAGSSASEPTEPMTTDAVSAPWISAPPLPRRPADQVVDERQPTAGATRPVPSAPAAPEPPRRRRWPLLTAVLATASVGAAVGVWLASPPPPDSSDKKVETAGPPLYPVAVNAQVTAEGHVVLEWSSSVEELPGFQSYSVFRDGAPFTELDGGTDRYIDPEPGTRPCYLVFALGVTRTPPDPPPPAQCVNR